MLEWTWYLNNLKALIISSKYNYYYYFKPKLLNYNIFLKWIYVWYIKQFILEYLLRTACYKPCLDKRINIHGRKLKKGSLPRIQEELRVLFFQICVHKIKKYPLVLRSLKLYTRRMQGLHDFFCLLRQETNLYRRIACRIVTDVSSEKYNYITIVDFSQNMTVTIDFNKITHQTIPSTEA